MSELLDPNKDPKTELPRFSDLKPGDIFAVFGQELYPKIKMEDGGYWDLHKSIYNKFGNEKWKCRQYTQEGTIEILKIAHNITQAEAKDRVYNWPERFAAAKEEIDNI